MATRIDPDAPPRTPPGITITVFLALGAAISLIFLWLGSIEIREAPGAGKLGLDATKVGPRVLWSDVPAPAGDATKADATKGAALYKQWCASCHGENGAADGVLAAALNPPPRNFTVGRYRFRTTPEGNLPSDADLYRTISAGILPSRMPAYGFLSSEDRLALVAHVKRLSAFFDEDEKKSLNHFELNPPEPSIDYTSVAIAADPAGVERGRKLFFEKGQCWQCHGQQGLGDGPSAPTLKAEEGYAIKSANLRRGPALLKSVKDARDVYRVLKGGLSGTPMPSYAASLTDDELKDISRFTESLWLIEPREHLEQVPLGSVALTGTQSLVEFGERTFINNCAGCHGKRGRGDGVAAELMRNKPASLATGIFKFKTTPDGCFADPSDIKRTLRLGVAGSSMPAWNLNAEAELDALVAYIQSLSAGRALAGASIPVPLPPPGVIGTADSVARGRELFTKNCSVCHGLEGRGDGEFADIVADYRGEKIRPRNLREEPMKYGTDVHSLFRVVSYGFEGTPMPGFANAIPEAGRFDLVSYIQSIRGVVTASVGAK